MNDNLSQFKHIYIHNQATKTLVLLHGTGGEEHDFLFLDQPLKQSYNLLGLRGNVQEGRMNRFFRRFEFGVFDEKNIKEEAEKLKQFIEAWQTMHPEELTFLGYSNGANMLLAMLFYYPEMLGKAILLHPMMPLQTVQQNLDLSKNKIFMSYGTHDPMVSHEKSQEVIDVLASLKADLTAAQYKAGHGLTPQEINDVIAFLSE